MSQKFEIGAYGGVLIGSRDVTRHTKTFNSTQNIAPQDSTSLQPPGNAMTYIAGLETDALSFGAMLPVSKTLAEAQMKKALGLNRNPEPILLGPWGIKPGYYAEFLETEQTRFNPQFVAGNITSYSADFVGSGGIKRGVVLQTSQTAAVGAQNEIALLIFTNADPNRFYALRAVGTTQVFQFNAGITNAAFKAGLEGLAAYTGRTVTVTGADLTGTTQLNGAKTFEFNGAVDVPAMEVLVGAVQTFNVTGGDGGNYKSNNGANFALGITEANFQINQRAIGGQYANVVSKGTSVAPIAPVKENKSVTGSGALYVSGTTTNGAFAFDNDPLTSATVPTSGSGSSLGWTFTNPTIIDSVRMTKDDNNPIGQDINATIEGSVNGTFSDAVVLKTFSGSGAALWNAGVVETFVNTTAYKAYRMKNSEGISIPIKSLEFMADGATTPGNASFTNYFPVAATPAAPSVSGTNAVAAITLPSGTQATDIDSITVQGGGYSGGGLNVVSAAFNGTDINNGASTNDGGKAIINVPYFKGNSATVRIQHADDDGSGNGVTYTTVGVFDVITGIGAQVLDIPRGTVIKQHTRIAITSGQIDAQLAFSSALSRNPSVPV